MSDCVWLCNALTADNLSYPFATAAVVKATAEIRHNPGHPNELLDRVFALNREYQTGKSVLNSDLLSEEMYLQARTARTLPPPHIFTACGYVIVSSEFRAKAEEFDLGRTRFKPVNLFGLEKKTSYGVYNYLNIQETKESIDIGKSNYLQPIGSSGFFSYDKSSDEADHIAVNGSALVGADLWLELAIPRSIMFSDRLKRALKNSGLAAKLKFTRCRVI
jgi:hypothetical protein